MPQSRSSMENVTRWIEQAGIDYFTEYVKAWIPFNAWYRVSFGEGPSDQEIINTIKQDDNSFRDSLVYLLNDRGNAGQVFRSRIGELHNALGQKKLVIGEGLFL